MLRLSIVIPVYNVEKYVGRCLDSVLRQDIPVEDYEIVVVDDGSPDNSVNIVREYQKKYDNIRIVSRDNGGLSAARNTGLNEANGEYVWFIDSDDWVEDNCVGELLSLAEKKRLDVLCFNAKIYHSEDNIYDIKSPTEREGEVFNGQDFVAAVNTIPSAWSALYRRQYLIDNGLKFYENLLHEDHEFTPRAYSLAGRIAYIHRNVYYYFQREGSIMKSSRNEKRCRDFLKIADSLYAFAKEHFSDNPKVLATFNYKVNFAVTQSLAFYDKKYFSLREYKNKPYYPLSINNARGAFGWKCRLINFSLPLYHFIYKCLKK